MAKSNGNGGKKSMKATDLNDLAKKLSDKYGIDFNTILQLLMEWGPKLVALILTFFSKQKKEMASVACSQDVKDHLDAIIEKQSVALAESVCAKCCLCCEDDDEDE